MEPRDLLVSSTNTVEQLAMCWHCTVEHISQGEANILAFDIYLFLFVLFLWVKWECIVRMAFKPNMVTVVVTSLNVTTHILNIAVIWKILTFIALQNAALARNWYHAWVLHLKKKKMDCGFVSFSRTEVAVYRH